MTFYFYWQEKDKNLKFEAIDRHTAIEKLQKKTHLPWLEIDSFLKSDLQMATLHTFRKYR